MFLQNEYNTRKYILKLILVSALNCRDEQYVTRNFKAINLSCEVKEISFEITPKCTMKSHLVILAVGSMN